ncbi:spinster family MFS transporter [Parapedomonas caeni]|jgi:MFS family permease
MNRSDDAPEARGEVAGATQDQPGHTVGGAYAWYVLGVLIVVYTLNFIDRQIITILAADLKRDLGLTDTELGLLYGTVFAMFYALFGVPLGRLADTWVRTRMMAIGLAAWSAFTTVSGLAGNFAQLATARVGVGIGEASASPAAFSLLSDYFPREKRATALALYSSGVHIGGGLSLVIGGAIVDAWATAYADGSTPWGLKGWQVAFFAVGIPGILLALLVATLREPVRGLADGLAQPREPRPFAKAWLEMTAIIPPLTFWHLARLKAAGGEWGRNLLALAVVVALAAGLTALTNGLVPEARQRVLWELGGLRVTAHTVQWTAMAIGAYGVFSWIQSLRLRDQPSFQLIWKTPTTVAIIIASAAITIAAYGIAAWAAYYAVVTFKVPLTEAGTMLGLGAALGGWIGTSLGGIIGDRLRRRRPAGRLYVTLFAVIVPVPLVYALFSTGDLDHYYVLAFLVQLLMTLWLAGAATTCQDLVMPRMRGSMTAAFFLGTTLVGLGIGPYFIGFVSDVTGDLRMAIFSVGLFAPVAWIALLVAIRTVEPAERTRLERARAAGEPA